MKPQLVRAFLTLWAAFLAAAMLTACFPWDSLLEPTTSRTAAKPLPTVPPGILDDGNATRGQALFASKGCVVCHAIGGEGGSAGPALDGIGNRTNRPTLAGNLENTPENTWRWITNPRLVKRDTLMASQPLTPQEAADLVAYLVTLK